MLKRVIISISLVGILILTFQNCSKGDGDRSMEYVVKKENTTPPLIADNDILDAVEGISSSSTALSCFQDYITIFEWKNPSANLMSERPQLGAAKVVSLKLKEGELSDPRISSDWRIEAILNVNKDASTSASIQFLKAKPSSDSLDCYFMRVVDNSDLTAGLANVHFKDVGAEADANTFIGFLRHQEQFIACRVSAGQGQIELKSDGEPSTLLSQNQAFVMKRGCY